jgi:hypothetical protein
MSFLGEVVTADEAARHVGVTRSALCYWQKRGKLAPYGRRGRTLLYLMLHVVDAAAAMAADEAHSHRRKVIDGTGA